MLPQKPFPLTIHILYMWLCLEPCLADAILSRIWGQIWANMLHAATVKTTKTHPTKCHSGENVYLMTRDAPHDLFKIQRKVFFLTFFLTFHHLVHAVAPT